MIVPTLRISVPDHVATVLKSHRGAENGLAVVVLAQTYDNIQAQQYLADVCRRAADQAGVRSVALEGSDRQITAPTGPGATRDAQPPAGKADSVDLRPDIQRLIASGSEVSAGAIALHHREPDRFELWGVDDLARVARSQVAMTTVVGNATARDVAFAAVSEVLATAQRKVYSPELAALRQDMMPFSARRLSLAERVSAITKEAGRLGVALDPFPSVQQYGELHRWEQKTNTRRVEKQRATFVKRLASGLFGWFQRKGKNVVTIDRAKLQPVLEDLVGKTGMKRSDYDRLVQSRGIRTRAAAAEGVAGNMVGRAGQERKRRRRRGISRLL